MSDDRVEILDEIKAITGEWPEGVERLLLREVARLAETGECTPAEAADLAYCFASAGVEAVLLPASLGTVTHWLTDKGQESGVNEKLIEYEGRLAINDVEPFATGDVIEMLDDLRDDGFPRTLDSEMVAATGVHYGEIPGRFRIVIERVEAT